MKKPGESAIGYNVDTDFNAWIGSLENGAEQEFKVGNAAETMGEIPCHLVSSSPVTSNAFLFKTCVERFDTWQHEAQAYLDFLQKLAQVP